MLDIEYQILLTIQKTPNCQWLDVLNAFKDKNKYNSVDAILGCLVESGLVVADKIHPKSGIVKVSKPSILEIQRETERRDKVANEKREKQKERIHDAIIALASAAFGAFFSEVLPLLIEAVSLLILP